MLALFAVPFCYVFSVPMELHVSCLAYLKMAEKNRAKATKASTNAGSRTWTDEETETLLDIFAEETIQHSLDTAKSPKDKNAVHRDVEVQLEVKGEI